MDSGFFPDHSGVGEAQGLEFSDPVSTGPAQSSNDLAASIFALGLLLLGRLSQHLGLSALDPLPGFVDLLLDVLDLGLGVAHSFLHHLVDPFQVGQFLLEFVVALLLAGLEPLGVDLLLALEFGEGTLGSIDRAGVDFGETGLLEVDLNGRRGTFYSRLLTLSMLFLSQTSRFSCISSRSSNFTFRFLFSFISYFSCRAVWSWLLARLLRLNSPSRYSSALFLWASSRTSFFNCCSSTCLCFSSY